MSALTQAISMAAVIMTSLPTKHDIHDLIQGYVQGIIQQNDLPELAACFTEFKKLTPIL